MEQLSAQLKEKADCCSELLLGSEQLRRELAERDQEIDKLESRVRELEQALLASAESLEKVRESGKARGWESEAHYVVRVCVCVGSTETLRGGRGFTEPENNAWAVPIQTMSWFLCSHN